MSTAGEQRDEPVREADEGGADHSHHHHGSRPGGRGVYPPGRTGALAYLDDEVEGEENPDEFRLTSVGVDIGSATSHFLISRLTMRRLGKSMLSRYIVVERETLFRSAVSLTPYRDGGLIDADKLQAFVARSYEQSGVAQDEIDTGVVLLTGEALRRENARAIATQLSDSTGRFVCASAGHHLESRVAAHGAGTVERSRRQGERLLNLDIGGGTAKLALVDRGEIVSTGAVNVGGRLIATESGVVSRVEPSGEWAAESVGLRAELGARIDESGMRRIAAQLASCLMEVLEERDQLSPLAERLVLTERVPGTRDVDAVILSGGVSEFFAGSTASFGDLARPLAEALAPRLGALYGGRVEVSPAGMRATVVGLSQFTVEASGDTIFVSAPSPLPIRNVPMLRVKVPDDPVDFDLSGALAKALAERDLAPHELVGVALEWQGVPRYPALAALTRVLAAFFRESGGPASPAVVVVSQDCAKSLGHLLAEEMAEGTPIVCIDGLSFGDFDFIDVGTTVPRKSVVPVVIKSLLFPSAVT